jgi:hypothetical protein
VRCLAPEALSALAPLLRGDGPRLVAGVPIGRSADGRALRLDVSGNPAAPSRLLVVDCIHGDECAGAARGGALG